MRPLDPANVRAYVMRDWKSARIAKSRYWRERLDQRGLAEALRVVGDLRQWMQRIDPTWPTEKQREEDLETHRRVAEALAKAPRTRT